MLEDYFIKPETVDRIRSSWIGPQVEQYVTWLSDHRYSARCVWRRVPLLTAFGEHARRAGARSAADLPAYVDGFVAERVRQSRTRRRTRRPELAREIRGPVEHMLSVVLAGYSRRRPPRAFPFAGPVPGFFRYLEHERGLRPATIALYRHHLAALEAWLERAGAGPGELSPPLISAFIADRAAQMSKASMSGGCTAMRAFLRYAHREGALPGDLSTAVGQPQVYRLADLPRSISWEEVGQMFGCVDRRTAVGKRDYAMLVLMATYGLRAREIAALTLDDIDWKRERLAVPSRKAGHSTAFPLSQAAGEAVIGYLQHGRPQTASRSLFLRAVPPAQPVSHAIVSSRARHYLKAAGITVRRPGSHTLRHSCVQRLERRGVASDATFREKREDTRPALQLPRRSQRAGRVRQQCGDDLRCHRPVASTERTLQPFLLHRVTRMMRQMQRKAQRRGGMPPPPAPQGQVFGRVGKPLPTSFDAGFGWKTIGDYAGHRSPKSTEIYTKVAVESLRQVAMGDGEEALER